jgi:hypothetical protein
MYSPLIHLFGEKYNGREFGKKLHQLQFIFFFYGTASLGLCVMAAQP